MNDLTLNVSGMSCAGCEEKIRLALEDVPGVASTTASHETGDVRVELDVDQASVDDVRRAIEQAGYEVRS